MPTALQELNARLDDLSADIHFVAAAAVLRPRLPVDWTAAPEAVALAQSFLNQKSSNPERILSGILVRLVAAFERFMRQLVEASVQIVADKTKSYESLSQALSLRNLFLTGRVLASASEPRDHISYNYFQLVENLQTCAPGSANVKLNGAAFAAVVTSVSPMSWNVHLGMLILRTGGTP